MLGELAASELRRTWPPGGTSYGVIWNAEQHVAIDDSIRSELIRRARDKRSRQNVTTSAEPCQWYPYRVLHPMLGIPFTDVSAWNYIVDLLSAGHHVCVIKMQKPPGQLGYVLKTPGYKGCPDIYASSAESVG
jgi:hypothetical protein